jgi:cell division protein FtsB
MADENNLVLEQLRAMRAAIDEHGRKLDDLVYRVGSLEQQTAGLRADLAHYSARQDQLEQRLQRVEHRLELTE